MTHNSPGKGNIEQHPTTHRYRGRLMVDGKVYRTSYAKTRGEAVRELEAIKKRASK